MTTRAQAERSWVVENKLTLLQAAELLGRHPDEVKTMACSGMLPAVKVDGQWWFDRFELHQWQYSTPHRTYTLHHISDDDLARWAKDRTYEELGNLLGVTGSVIGHRMRNMGERRYTKHG